jgi:hypothetical protein
MESGRREIFRSIYRSTIDRVSKRRAAIEEARATATRATRAGRTVESLFEVHLRGDDGGDRREEREDRRELEHVEICGRGKRTSRATK